LVDVLGSGRCGPGGFGLNSRMPAWSSAAGESLRVVSAAIWLASCIISRSRAGYGGFFQDLCQIPLDAAPASVVT
jgi:hypothetical protein